MYIRTSHALVSCRLLGTCKQQEVPPYVSYAILKVPSSTFWTLLLSNLIEKRNIKHENLVSERWLYSASLVINLEANYRDLKIGT